MKHPSIEQSRKAAYEAATAVLVAERVNRSTWEEKGRGEAQDRKDGVSEEEMIAVKQVFPDELVESWFDRGFLKRP